MIDAPDDDAVSVDEAILLVDEIKRLRSALVSASERLAALEKLAHEDPLVRVPNRRSFVLQLQRLIARVHRYGEQAAMLFIDVDGLKAINDQFGHAAGDRALVQIAQLLVATVRKSDFVGRLAGDEFGVLLEHCDELAAWQMALRIIESIDESQFCIGTVCLPLSVAAGVGAIRRGDNPELVFERADNAMYRIKAAARVRPAALRTI